MSKSRVGRPAAFGKTAASLVDGAEMRRGADPRDLPFTDERQLVPAITLEEGEFEARGTGIEGEYVAARHLRPARGKAEPAMAFARQRPRSRPYPGRGSDPHVGHRRGLQRAGG
jgi:hypothetical protein